MRNIHIVSLFIIFISIVPSTGDDMTIPIIPITYKAYVDQNYGFYRVIDTTTHKPSEYENRVLTINTGDTITWVNDADPAVSLTIVNKQGLWKDTYLKSRQEFSYTFNQQGTYDIYIKEYSNGKQKIIVNSLIIPTSIPITTDVSNNVKEIIKEKTLYIGETWEIGDGWAITAQSIDRISIPGQAWIVLSKSGYKIDDIIVSEGGIYDYGDIVEMKIASIYYGENTDTVTLKDIVYHPDGNKPLKGESFILAVGETKDLGNGFTITIPSIDKTTRHAQLILRNSGTNVYDKFVSVGDIYNYDNIVTMNVQNIFFGPTIDIVKLASSSAQSEQTSSNAQSNEQMAQSNEQSEQTSSNAQSNEQMAQSNEQMSSNTMRFIVMLTITFVLSISLIYILRKN